MPRKKTAPPRRFGTVIFAKDVDRMAAFYAGVLGSKITEREEDFVVIEAGDVDLVVHRMSLAAAARTEIAKPPVPRSNTAIKPVFTVASLEKVRGVAAANGGSLKPASDEWTIRGAQVCDGLDPEGNVIQFQER